MTGVKKIKALFAIMLTGVMSTWAQSPYTWSADNWEYVTGNGTNYAGDLVTKSIDWGCVQLNAKDSFTLTASQTYLVVRGFTLTGNTNNPNISDINGTSYQQSFKGTGEGGSFTLNTAGTMLYADLSSILPAAANGKRTITSFKLILNATEEDLPIITSIEFTDAVPTNDAGLTHPCMLHSAADFTRIQENITKAPWSDAYAHLQASTYAQSTYTNGTSALADGYLKRMDASNWGPNGQIAQYSDYANYTALMYDAAAAYQLALRYKISGETQYASAAVNILNAWKNNCKGILRLSGYSNNVPDPNEYLIMIQGHQMANAAEMLRDYSGWASSDFEGFKKWMRITFLDISMICLAHRTPGKMHRWLNWDLASLTSVLSIGILCDDKSTIDWAINFFKNEQGLYNEVGNIRNAVPYLHQDPDSYEVLGQCQESGRDQGHATLCVALMGTFCQMALNIGEDLFAYDNYRALKMAEYVGKYNLIKDASWSNSSLSSSDFVTAYSSMPYTAYSNNSWECPTISSKSSPSGESDPGRGSKRPAWEVFYGYAKANNLQAIYSQQWTEQMRSLNSYKSDGGGGDYGPNSSGFDQLGYGTLMYARPDVEGATSTTAINFDTHVRSDNTSDAYGSSANTEIYNNTGTNSKEFVQLINFTMPTTPVGYDISKVTLRLVSKRTKNEARKGINIYNYPHTVTNDATWGSESNYITTARQSDPITTFEAAGEVDKDVVLDAVSSDYYDISAWTNDIDITSFASSKGGEAINLLLSASHTQSNDNQVCFFSKDCSLSYTNNNTKITYYKADLVPQLFVEYEAYPKTDMIDYSSSVVTAKSDGITISSNANATEHKTILTFTPTAASEVGLTFNAEGYNIDNTQNFFVIEANGGAIATTGNFKCRSMKLDNTNYEANETDMKALFTIGDRQVLILSPLGQSTSTAIFNKFYNTPDGTSISASQATVYFHVASTSEVTIYRAGLYNLGEILELYPSLKGRNWQFVAADALRLESYADNNGAEGSDGIIRIKDDNTSKSTYAVFEQQMRSLGTLPANFTSAYYLSFQLEDGTTPTTKDLLTPVAGLQFTFTKDMLRYFPTLTPKKVKADQCYYWAYKDGIAPQKDNFYVHHTWDNCVVDFTRYFYKGYNSCILPFVLDVTKLPDGWSAYTFRDYTGSTLRFTQAGNSIAANIPFLIKMPTDAIEGLYVIPSTNTKQPINPTDSYYPTAESNGARFVGSYVNEIPTDTYGTSKYGIDINGEVKKIKDTTKTTYYRAFIAINITASVAKSVSFIDTELTGISNSMNHNNSSEDDNIIYDLTGRKVEPSNVTKGIYIINGNKIVIR